MKMNLGPLQVAQADTLSKLLRLGLMEEFSESTATPPVNETGLAGKTIGDYEILRELGRGGSGTVYLAHQKSLNRLAALKFLSNLRCSDENSRSRFRREAQLVASLQHPRIVRVYEFGFWEGSPYYVMQFIEGANLKERIRRGVLPWQQAADWAASISETVHFAHGEGVFHRDLKPQNILVDQQDQLHLVDFGLARKLEDSEGLTMTGTIVGTIHYLAPELLTGGNLSAASEVYAIGAVLYEMLTGIPPFAGESLTELMENIRRGSPVPPSQLRPSIPIALEIVCLKCLRRAPSRRYAAAGELRDALRRSLKASSGAWMSDIFHDAARLRLRLGWIALLVVFLALCFWGWSKNQSADSNSVLMAEKGTVPKVSAIDPSQTGVIRLLPGDPLVKVGSGWTESTEHWSCSLARYYGDTLQISLPSPSVDFDLAMTFTASSDADLAAYPETIPQPDINQGYVANIGAYDDGRSLLRFFGREAIPSTFSLPLGVEHVMQMSRRKGWIIVLLDAVPILAHTDPQPSLRVDRLVVWGGFGGQQQVRQICYRVQQQ